MPALLWMMSSPPSCASANWISFCIALPSDVSARKKSARPPAVVMRSTVSRASASLRSATTTEAPSRASRSAVARPIPEPPPVTMAALPLTSTVRPPRPRCSKSRRRESRAAAGRVALVLAGLRCRGAGLGPGGALLHRQDRGQHVLVVGQRLGEGELLALELDLRRLALAQPQHGAQAWKRVHAYAGRQLRDARDALRQQQEGIGAAVDDRVGVLLAQSTVRVLHDRAQLVRLDLLRFRHWSNSVPCPA